jgi:membrane protein DedA with SNARE-associated domain
MIAGIDLTHLAISSPISYLLAFLLPAGDALIPVLPGESVIITLGVATAGSTDPRIAVLVLLAALGAFVGDNATYLVGRRLGPWIDRKVFSSPKGQRRRAWAEEALDKYGARIIIVCRFIPGGRTAVMLTCGLVGYKRRTVVIATAVAAVIWASYAFFIGRLGGAAFRDNPWAGLLLAFGVAVGITGLVELVRRLAPWRWFSRSADHSGESPDKPPDAPDEHDPEEPAGPPRDAGERSAGQEVGVDGAGLGGQGRDLDHGHAAVGQPLRTAAGHEQRGLEPGQHNPADARREDQLGA